jgi:hypothetical protein
LLVYGERVPELRPSVELLTELEPFYMRVRRNVENTLPFTPSGSHREARAASDACARLLATLP